MGRKARFSSEVVVKFLIDNIQHFATCVPPWKDPIWKTFSKALATDDAEWKPDTIYNHVKKDRRGDLSEARKACNINVDISLMQPTFQNDSDFELDESFDVIDVSDPPYCSDNLFKKKDHSLFSYVLNQSEWNIIKPQPNQSNSEKRTLKKKVWANVLLESFWLLYKLPCAFVVDHHYVSNSLNKQFFIKCEGHCKEKKTCNNTFIIIIKDDPGDDPPVINFYTRDTRGELFHEQVKRPCNGSEREKHGKALQGKAIIPYRRQVARTLMPEGGVESPFIPNPDVLRHAKKEVLDRELGIDSSQKISMFEKIAALRFSPDFNKTIREVGLPFYTFYSTPRQLTLFQEYCKLEKESEICVDASGVFCEELIEPGGKKCGHIFLYVVTIHWGNQTYPVYQMLSTQHNNVFIAHWLKYWHHLLNAPIPKLTVCDYGRALLLALCDTYNSMHLTNYIDLCLDWLLKNNKRLPIPKKINSIMKVDVAHVIHFVTKWKCFKDERGKFLKNTYVRIVALMIDCNDIIKFQELYLLLCVISLQQYEDSVVNIPLLPGIKTVQQAYNKLMDYIGNRKVYCDLIEELGDTIVDDDRCQPPEIINSQLTDETTTKKWILKLQTSAMVTIKEGTKLNAYYFKLFMDSFETLANEFPLWTGVMTPFKIEHASSSYGEGYFSYLKNLLLKPYKRPMTVEKFLRVHIRDCEGADIVMGAKVQDYIIKKMRKKIPTGDTIVENLMEKSDEINNGVAFSNSIYQDNITQSIDLSLDVLNKSNKLVYETWKGRVNNDIHGFGPYDDVNLEYSTIDSDFFHDNRINDVVNSTPAVPSGVNDINSSIGLPIEHSTMINEDVSCNQDHIFNISSNISTNISSNISSNISLVNLDHSYSRNNLENDGTSIPKKKEIYKLKKTKSKPGLYFRPCPEIQVTRNLKKPRVKKQYLLSNGNISSHVKLSGMLLFVQNTCGFDSIVQVLHSAVLDDDSYWEYVINSSETILQFVKNFTLHGNTVAVLLQRAKILSQFFESKRDVSVPQSRIHYMNGETWITNYWNNLFSNLPSLSISYTCSKSKTIKQAPSSIYIECDWKYLTNSDQPFNDLQNSLLLSKKGRKCTQKNCTGTILNEKVQSNRQIFIELDVRSSQNFQEGLHCMLKDFPITLQVDGLYRLAGVIHYVQQQSHFIAYCRRMNYSKSYWQECNSQPAMMKNVSDTTEVLPHGVIYIKT